MLFGKEIFTVLPSLSQFMDLRPQLFKALFTKQCIMSQHGTEVVNGSQILRKLYAAAEYRSLRHSHRREGKHSPTQTGCQLLSWYKSKQPFPDKENNGDLYALNHIECLLSNTDQGSGL